MAAELRVDTIKGRSGINTFTFKGDGFSFDQKVGIGTTVASDPVLSTNAGKLSVGVVSTYSLYSDGAIFSANVSIGGSLTVDGTQTIINTEELNIQDKTIGIGSTSSPTSSTQDGAGIHIFGQTRVDMLYDNNKSALGFSTSIDVTGFATFSSGIKAQDVSIAGAAATLSANGNATFSGIVTASSFVGGLPITSGADNRVITASSASAIQGESGLTYDGSTLGVTGDVTMTNTSSNPQLALISAANGIGEIQFGDANDAVRGNIIYRSGSAGDALCFNGYNNTERLRITSGGQVSISGAGTTFGNNTLLNIEPANRTTAFDASDGDTWHDVVLMQGGGATNNAVGIAFEIEDGGSYHKNAGTGIAAVKNGTNSDYGADLVFVTRPQSAAAKERLRITDAGAVGINSATPTANYKLDVNGDLTLGEIGGTDNTYIDQKQDGDLHLINSGRTSNGASGTPGAGGVGINRYNNIAGDTSLFRDFTVYNGKSSKVLVVDGSTSRVGVGTDTPEALLQIEGTEVGLQIERNAQTLKIDANYGNGGDQSLTASSALRIYTGGANERVRITSGGELQIGGNEGGYRTNIIRESSDTTTAETQLLLYAKHDGSGNTGVGYGGGIRFWGDRNGDNAEQNMGRIMCTADVNSGTTISGALSFETAEAGVLSEKARITSAGQVLTGHDTALVLDSAATFQEQLVGTSFATSGSGLYRFENGTSGPTLSFAHSRNGTKGSHTILQDGDELGKIRFYGSDGVDFGNHGASIRALVNGTPGADDMPGALCFDTTADGAVSPTERIRITKEGYVQIKYNGSATTPNCPLYVGVAGKSSITYAGGQSSDTACLRIEDEGTNDSYYHGLELRTKNSGDVRIYAHDQGSSNAVDLVFATDNNSDSPEIQEKLRIKSDGTADFNENTVQKAVLKNYTETVKAIGDTGTSATLDLADGNVFTATLTGNCTFTFTTGTNSAPNAASFTLILANDSTPSRTITWPGSVKWPNNSAPSRTTTASKTDIWTFMTPDNGTTWYGNIALYNFT